MCRVSDHAFLICCMQRADMSHRLEQEGLRGFYRGWAANALKVIPQNSIRFASYEALKGLLEV